MKPLLNLLMEKHADATIQDYQQLTRQMEDMISNGGAYDLVTDRQWSAFVIHHRIIWRHNEYKMFTVDLNHWFRIYWKQPEEVWGNLDHRKPVYECASSADAIKFYNSLKINNDNEIPSDGE